MFLQRALLSIYGWTSTHSVVAFDSQRKRLVIHWLAEEGFLRFLHARERNNWF